MGDGKSERGFYRNYYREIDVLHGLQAAPEERDWLLTVPKDGVKQSDIVLYLGCNVLRTTHLVRTVMDVFKLLEADFTAVGGASYCCGIQHHQRGDEASARSVAQTTASNFRKFQPEQVVMWCPSCIFFYDDIMDMREEFSFQHVTEYLVQNLHKLDFQPQQETTVALHYHTGRPQSDAEAQSALTLLGRLPGVTLRDIGADPRFGRHCTPAVRQQMGPEAWDAMSGQWAQRAVDAGADTYATLYHGCQRHMCALESDYPVRVEHYLTLVGRALGIEHEDQYKKHTLLGDPGAVLAETAPCALASGIPLEEAQAVIGRTFPAR